MGIAIELFFTVTAVGFPFIAMPLLWRRMRRVQRQVLAARELRRPEPAWEETLDRPDGVRVSRRGDPNDELIDLGDRARYHRWPLSNE